MFIGVILVRGRDLNMADILPAIAAVCLSAGF